MPTKDLSYYLGIKYPAELHEREGGWYFVTHPDLDGCMAEGASLQEALANLADARELWIATRLDNGYEVPEPSNEAYSGKVSVRMATSLHAQLVHLAARQDISLNLLINTILASYAGGADPLAELTDDLKKMLGTFATPPALPNRAKGGLLRDTQPLVATGNVVSILSRLGGDNG